MLTYRACPFTIVSTMQGTFIANIFDRDPNDNCGVSAQLFAAGVYDPLQSEKCFSLIQAKKKFLKNVCVADVGANIGVFSISWGMRLDPGDVIFAIEPQKPLYYALCGNVVLNNLPNVQPILAAASNEVGSIGVPVLDYSSFCNFGGVSLIREADDKREIRQVPTIRIDDLPIMPDFLKIDVEGMEVAVIEGARRTISEKKPAIFVEYHKIGLDFIRSSLPEYVIFSVDRWNVACIHQDDPFLVELRALGRENQDAGHRNGNGKTAEMRREDKCANFLFSGVTSPLAGQANSNL